MQSPQHRAPMHIPSPDQPPIHEKRGQDDASRCQRHPPQDRRERWLVVGLHLREIITAPIFLLQISMRDEMV